MAKRISRDSRDIAAYNQARADWLLAIEQNKGHTVISNRWEMVRATAQRVGFTPGAEVPSYYGG